MFAFDLKNVRAAWRIWSKIHDMWKPKNNSALVCYLKSTFDFLIGSTRHDLAIWLLNCQLSL